MYSLLAFLAGLLTPLAFAPIGLFPFAVIAPAILLWLWLDVTPKQALWRGWLYGLGMFGAGVSWVYISIHEFGNTPPVLAAILTAIFILFLALFPAIQGYVLTRWFPGRSLTKLLLAFPAIWVFSEWIRSWILTGFPWLLIGYSQISSPLKGFIPLVGEFGVAFFVLLSSGCMVSFLYAKKSARYFLLCGLLSLWIVGAGLGQIQWTTLDGQPKTVALVQGNISQHLKWDNQYLQKSVDTYLELTQPYWGTEIIVWPEAALPIPLQQIEPFIKELNEEAKKQGTALLLGLPIQASSAYYNGMIGVGEGEGVYHKHRLVPFGEYVPLDRYLRGVIGFFDIPMSNFISGFGEPLTLSAHDLYVAPFICYEIAYSSLLRRDLPQAKFLVTISNMSWFGDSLAPWQHLEMGRFRALQVGRDLLLVGNDGITAIVDDKGRIQSSMPQFQMGVLTGTVQPRSGSTPWVLWGNAPILILMGVLLLFARRMIGRDGRI